MRLLALAVCMWCVLGSLGCSERPVAEDLDQQQANELVAFLHDRGVVAYAERGVGGKARYRVDVPSSSYGEAISLMQQQGLPSEPKASFAELTTSGGFLPPSRDIEALRLDRARAVEVVEMLENHPAVAEARAVVRSDSQKDNKASVSVVLKTRPGVLLNRDDITRVVQASIPEVQADQIQVIASEVVPGPQGTGVTLVPFLSWRVPEADYVGLALTLVGCMCIIAVVGAVLGYWFGVSQHTKVFRENEPMEVASRAIRFERRKNLPES
ncbi:MAG: hypothetical protein QY326_00550 [Bdellovibrionota bacterium]|nr:MAG: hypothetical protein QY326_00550 [Bdellovibrionota bacterium]